MSDISLSQLLEAGVHFGHKAYRWNPKMFPYIYSEVNNIHILDLVQSATLLKEANNYLESAAKEGKIIFIYWNKTSSKYFNCTRSKTL
jgi:small subunit ribosomal protein S2